MVVLCTIKIKEFGKISYLERYFCTYLMYSKFEIHKLPTPFLLVSGEQGERLHFLQKNLLSPVVECPGILVWISTEGPSCNTLNRTLFL